MCADTCARLHQWVQSLDLALFIIFQGGIAMWCPLRNLTAQQQQQKALHNLVLHDFYLSWMNIKLSIILDILCIFHIINTIYLPKGLLAPILLGNACLCLCPFLIRLFMVLLPLTKNVIILSFIFEAGSCYVAQALDLGLWTSSIILSHDCILIWGIIMHIWWNKFYLCLYAFWLGF